MLGVDGKLLVPEFDDLLGQRVLFYGAHSGMLKLGGFVYEAIEDPSDGYRSYLGTIAVLPSGNMDGFYPAPLAVVIPEMITSSEHYESFDGYRLVDVIDGHVWLEVGTESNDDYYPCFIFNYYPKKESVMNPADNTSVSKEELDRQAVRFIAAKINDIFQSSTLEGHSTQEILNIIANVSALVAQRIEISKQLGE